jgi:hypothetical protein
MAWAKRFRTDLRGPAKELDTFVVRLATAR